MLSAADGVPGSSVQLALQKPLGEPLLDVARRDRSEDVKEAAKLAVRRIQGRLGAAGPGRLSIVAPGDEGALSVAGEEGEVSLPLKTR